MRIFCSILAVFCAFLGTTGCAGPKEGRLRTGEGRNIVVRIELPADPVLADRLEKSVTDGGCFRSIPGEDRSTAVPGCPGKHRIQDILWEKPGSEDADVRVVFDLSDPAREPMSSVRLPSWDRVWALEIDPNARWVNDPTFRRWLSARIDRWGIVQTVFGGRAVPVPEVIDTPGPRPVSEGARPRLALAYPVEDPVAGRIASRLRADLLPDQVIVELGPFEEEATNRMEQGMVQALRLVEIGADPAGPAFQRNEIVPLVRRQVWLLVREGLKGVRPGPSWRLDFSKARWRR